MDTIKLPHTFMTTRLIEINGNLFVGTSGYGVYISAEHIHY